MNTVLTVRHQAAIAGQVTDSFTGKAIAGADVAMTKMPQVFTKRLSLYAIRFGAKWSGMVERSDRTRSRSDGMFYFLDLPEGQYVLSISAPDFGKRYGSIERTVKVVRDVSGTFKLDWAVVALPPTVVKGGITSKKINVSFAQVRVQGSGESAYTDDAGQYIISRIEPGKRTLLVQAQGYRPISQAVSIAAPGDTQTVNFNLQRDAG